MASLEVLSNILKMHSLLFITQYPEPIFAALRQIAELRVIILALLLA
jgi:hypothetical protein